MKSLNIRNSIEKSIVEKAKNLYQNGYSFDAFFVVAQYLSNIDFDSAELLKVYQEFFYETISHRNLIQSTIYLLDKSNKEPIVTTKLLANMIFALNEVRDDFSARYYLQFYGLMSSFKKFEKELSKNDPKYTSYIFPKRLSKEEKSNAEQYRILLGLLKEKKYDIITQFDVGISSKSIFYVDAWTIVCQAYFELGDLKKATIICKQIYKESSDKEDEILITLIDLYKKQNDNSGFNFYINKLYNYVQKNKIQDKSMDYIYSLLISNKLHEWLYKFSDSFLKSSPYEMSHLFINAVSKFNIGKKEAAVQDFEILSELDKISYIPYFILQDAKENTPTEISYKYVIPENKENEISYSFNRFLAKKECDDRIARRYLIQTKNFIQIYSYCLYFATLNEIIITLQLNNKRLYKKLKTSLLDIRVATVQKVKILRAFYSYTNKILDYGFSYKNIYTNIKLLPKSFFEKYGLILEKAYFEFVEYFTCSGKLLPFISQILNFVFYFMVNNVDSKNIACLDNINCIRALVLRLYILILCNDVNFVITQYNDIGHETYKSFDTYAKYFNFEIINNTLYYKNKPLDILKLYTEYADEKE